MSERLEFFDCIQCGRRFRYGGPEKLGYSKEYCGPLCDGFWHGKQSRVESLDVPDREQLLRDVEIVRKRPQFTGMMNREYIGFTREQCDAIDRLAAHTRRTLLGEK